MFFKFKNKKISHLVAVVPSESIKYEEELGQYNFSEANSLQLKKVMGFQEHRIAPEKVTAVDMAVYGLNCLFDNNKISCDKIDAIIFITTTPDYLMPGSANIVQGKLNMKTDIICLDINQACAGFAVGMIQACMLLDTGSCKKIALINAETVSSKVYKKDRNLWPLIGDAAGITIVENGDEDVYASVYNDGSQFDSIYIPAGGSKIPYSNKTSVIYKDETENERSMEHISMDGIKVFNFMQKVVHSEINKLMEYASVRDEEIYAYCFHQPNKFMLDKLTVKLGVDKGKVLSNIVTLFGNSSSATIPMLLAYNYKNILTSGKEKLCFAGFGAGLTFAGFIMNVGNLGMCDLIEYTQ